MNKMILSIKEPCNQDWNAMAATESGRFCSSCSKTVVDFTSMTDAQLINYFLKHKDEHTCGRLLAGQLDTELHDIEPAKKRFGYWKYIAASALLFFSKASLKAQAKADSVPQVQMPISALTGDTVIFNAPKTLEEVKVTAHPGLMRSSYLMGYAGGISVKRQAKATRPSDTLKAIITNISGSARIFPNPLQKGNEFTLALNLKAAGIYYVDIVSVSGEILMHRQIEINTLKSTRQIAIDSRWAAGVYIVRLTDEVGKAMATCKLVLH